MRTICFILSSIQSIHSIKRIDEFVEQGYDVKVFGFNREDSPQTSYDRFDIEIIGTFSSEMPYHKRLPLLWKGIRKAKSKTRGLNCLWYYFGLDVALLGRLINISKPYIYEEADLTYTYINNSLLKYIFRILDKNTIKKSFKTVLTSDGFVWFLFGNKHPKNVSIITNRLLKSTLSVPHETKHVLDMEHLAFGFLGGARFESVYYFIKTVVKHFPQHQVVVYGTIDEKFSERYAVLEKYDNFAFYGRFSNPTELPKIYAGIDLVISTYDICYDNVKHAEPNKLYEAVYFETPIIVTEGTFLASKVAKYGIGYAVDALDEKAIVQFVEGLTKTSLNECMANCRKIDKMRCINDNQTFFDELKTLMVSL